MAGGRTGRAMTAAEQQPDALSSRQTPSPNRGGRLLSRMLNLPHKKDRSDWKKNSIFLSSADSWEPNDYERKLLQRTWSDEFEFLYGLGTDIYAYIFEKSPDSKKLFPVLAGAGDNWRQTRGFGQQALKFVQVLSHAIKNMYHTDRLDPILWRVGQAHTKFATRGFRPDHWVLFREAIEVTITERIKQNDMTEQEKADAIEQWQILALYIVHKMYLGFADAMEGKNSSPKSGSFESPTETEPDLTKTTPEKLSQSS